jgi:glycerol-3-phosphate dehydrogenase
VSDRYDVVVVGAGIHGAGVAQAAAARGYSVLVLEKSAPAAGTSSRSSKLIHGGLRYLESGQLALVRECLREREILLRNAPELVHRVPFYIPVYRHTSRPPWRIRAGLGMYAALGAFRRQFRFSSVPRDRWGALDGLETRDLRAVFRYDDAQTDDAALTRAVLASALALGARVDAPADFTGARLTGDGCEIEFRSPGRVQRCTARLLVNAAGPWVEEIAARLDPPLRLPAIDLVQGAHIVCQGQLVEGVYYVEAPRDRRAVFAMPWQGGVMVGTTETPYRGDPAAVHPRTEEIDYLRETYLRYFPAARADVRAAFAGLRVLPRAEGSAFDRPRDTLLIADRKTRPRAIAIVGGKLTAYRATAEKLMSRARASLAGAKPGVATDRIALPPAS